MKPFYHKYNYIHRPQIHTHTKITYATN